MKRNLALIAALATFCVLSPESARSQTTGTIAGTVTDSSGAVLPGVSVEARSASLQGIRSATTDLRGEYRFRPYLPGRTP